MVDHDRRKLIKDIAKGAVYVSPVVATIAAPARLMAQGPSGMMFMFCDIFPIICMFFGGDNRRAPGAAPTAPTSGPAAPAPGQPNVPPPPGSRPPGG